MIQIVHFAVWRRDRTKAEAQRRWSLSTYTGAIEKQHALCSAAQSHEPRLVAEFIRHAEPVDDNYDIDWRRNSGLKPCERCLMMYLVAKANGVPIRHQNLDRVVNSILSQQSNAAHGEQPK